MHTLKRDGNGQPPTSRTVPIADDPLLEVVLRVETSERICILLRDGSVCELDGNIELCSQMLASYDIKPTGLCFWFCRIKAKREGIGAGRVLMRELVKILDKNGWWVVNSINPYGRMQLHDLIKFNEKFGFVLLSDEGFMYRKPDEGVSRDRNEREHKQLRSTEHHPCSA